MKRIPKNLAVTLLGILFFANLAFADTSNPDKFAVTPANPDNNYNPKTLSLSYELRPGDQATGEINIKNYPSQQRDFVLYITDQYITEDGILAFKTENETNLLAGLAKPELGTVKIGPEETKTVKIMINIPPNQTLGDYDGGIAVVTTKPSPDAPNVNIAMRYIQKLHIKVTDTPSPIQQIVKADTLSPTPYFMTSLAVFLLSIGYFIWARRKEKNNGKTP